MMGTKYWRSRHRMSASDVLKSREKVRRKEAVALKYEEEDLFRKFKLGELSGPAFLDFITPVREKLAALKATKPAVPKTGGRKEGKLHEGSFRKSANAVSGTIGGVQR